MSRWIRLVSFLAMFVFAHAIGACESVPLLKPRASERAMWVTRFDYRTREDILRIVEACKLAGMNTILFQVRGDGTAMYHSSLEPWSETFNGIDPGFDPLAVAIQAAHDKGLRLHAWVNVVPAWWGIEPPKDKNQLYNKHPEWMWYDQKGKRQALSDKFYVSVNPCLPEVRRYLVEVMRDIVGRYSVDGLHLDYLRFPNEAPAVPEGSGLDYPRDKPTLALFRGETGHTPEEDPKAWDAWRTECVSNLLRDVRRMVRQTRPAVELSAAVGPVPDNAGHHFQDVRTWLAEDLIDAVYPMNYTRDLKVFNERVANWRTLAQGHPVVMGVRIEGNDVGLLRSELATALDVFHGYAIFAYSALFDSANTQLDGQDEARRAQRQELRKAMLPVLQQLAKPGGTSNGD